MKSVALYTRRGCHLCDVVKATLDAERAQQDFELVVVDIDGSAQLKADYGTLIPLVFVDGVEIARYRLDAAELRRALVEPA